MKTLKYRSAFAGIMVAALSVFLFTACEKESDSPAAPQNSKLEKFKRLTFSGGNSTSTTSTSSGTFTGGGGSVSFSGAGDGMNNSQFAPAPSGNSVSFTDPGATGNSFNISSLGLGGGTVTFNGTSYNVALGICVSDGSFVPVGSDSTQRGQEPNIRGFIGIAGDIDVDAFVRGEDEAEDLGAELTIFVFSYNGGTSIADIDELDGDNPRGAFVFVGKTVSGPNGDKDVELYFATRGSVSFSDGSVVMSGVRMEGLDLSEGNTLSTATMSALIECVEIEFEAEEI